MEFLMASLFTLVSGSAAGLETFCVNGLKATEADLFGLNLGFLSMMVKCRWRCGAGREQREKVR